MIYSIYQRLFIGAIALFSLGSCSENINPELEARSANEKAFFSYEQNNEYQKVSLPGNFLDRYILIKWINKSESRDQIPRSTDYVKIQYRGRLLRGLFEFDRQERENIKLYKKTQVNSYIPGVSIALQNMSVGDEAEIVIPWYLAYGSIGTRQIPHYSGLIFNIKLLEVSTFKNNE